MHVETYFKYLQVAYQIEQNLQVRTIHVNLLASQALFLSRRLSKAHLSLLLLLQITTTVKTFSGNTAVV